jgi:hypothetical protein
MPSSCTGIISRKRKGEGNNTHIYVVKEVKKTKTREEIMLIFMW